MKLRKFLFKCYQSTFINRLNIWKTLISNFLFLPFKHAIKFPILIYGKCKIVRAYLPHGKIKLNGKVHCGMLKIGISDPVRSYHNKSYIEILGTLIINSKVTFRRGINLFINRNASLEMSAYSYIGDNTTFICFKNIKIGKCTRFGNNVLMMDTDFHYIINKENRSIHKILSPIEIGDYNWIGGNCTIKKGTKTPTGTILAGPYSMICKDYTKIIEPFSIIAGSPAKFIRGNMQRVQDSKSESELNRFFENAEDNFVLPQNIDIQSFCTTE